MNILIILTVIFLIISKLFDCLSTINKIKNYNNETNPIANKLMKKIGIKNNNKTA